MSGLKESARATEVITTLLIIVLLLGALGFRSIRRTFAAHPSPEVCQALLDRYVEHIVYVHNPKPSASELDARKAEARALASKDKAFAGCPTYLTSEEADCAMRSFTADEFERCLP
ncbi:MAG TPA: hypothetical protein PK156_05090 [Polyangium sp.]|nr:hypothetical protein [Polyangium sp.]